MISANDSKIMSHVVQTSNMRQLSRIYRKCANTCSLPIKCLFSIPPVFYTIAGNYTQSATAEYNTVLTFTQDATITIYVSFLSKVTIALQADPNTIISTNVFPALPGIYSVPAGTEGWILTSSFNIPKC